MIGKKERARLHYPTSARVKQFVTAAQEAGLTVGGFECSPDGVVRILSERMLTPPGVNAYDEWKQADN